MRLLLAIFIFTLSPITLAKVSLPQECAGFEEISKEHFVLLDKKDFIQLGECTGVALLKRGGLTTLSSACSEVLEDKINPLGIFSLSKAEAIQIGQCVGVINYIYEHYHNESTNNRYGYSSGTYRCIRGEDAATRLSQWADISLSRSEVRELLCKS